MADKLEINKIINQKGTIAVETNEALFLCPENHFSETWLNEITKHHNLIKGKESVAAPNSGKEVHAEFKRKKFNEEKGKFETEEREE